MIQGVIRDFLYKKYIFTIISLKFLTIDFQVLSGKYITVRYRKYCSCQYVYHMSIKSFSLQIEMRVPKGAFRGIFFFCQHCQKTSIQSYCQPTYRPRNPPSMFLFVLKTLFIVILGSILNVLLQLLSKPIKVLEQLFSGNVKGEKHRVKFCEIL